MKKTSSQGAATISGRKSVQKFKFQSEIVLLYLAPGRREGLDDWCPHFVQPLLLELYEQVRGMDFNEPAAGNGSPHISMFDRSIEEVCELVDWTSGIWNQLVASEIRNRKLTAHELVRDTLMRDGWSSRDSLRWMLEGWGEGDEEWGGDYVSPDIFPFKLADDPVATPGNLCAAMGLAVLDYALLLRTTSSIDDVIDVFGAAWHFALVARSLNRQDMGHQFDIKSRSARMSRAAANRYSKDPKQAAKAQVKECWRRWREEQPDSYRRTTWFARDMLAKWPNELTSEAVVSRWVREWDREAR
jgi:hypothetical protein